MNIRKVKEVLEFKEDRFTIFIEIDYASQKISFKNYLGKDDFVFLGSSIETSLGISNLLLTAAKEAERRLKEHSGVWKIL